MFQKLEMGKEYHPFHLTVLSKFYLCSPEQNTEVNIDITKNYQA